MEVALWCLGVLALWGGCVFLFARKRERDRAFAEETLVRTVEHESMLLALKVWMADFRIIKVVRDQRHMTMAELLATAEVLDRLSFEDLKRVGAYFLLNREVRRAVARYEENRGGITHAEAMKPLLEWVTAVGAAAAPYQGQAS